MIKNNKKLLKRHLNANLVESPLNKVPSKSKTTKLWVLLINLSYFI